MVRMRSPTIGQAPAYRALRALDAILVWQALPWWRRWWEWVKG